MTDLLLIALYVLPLAVVMAIYLGRRRRRDRVGEARWNEAVAAGLTEPASLHSVVNRVICMGSGACVRAFTPTFDFQATAWSLSDGTFQLVGTPARPLRPACVT